MTEPNQTPPSPDTATSRRARPPRTRLPPPRQSAADCIELLESLRDAIDDLAERATPTVREVCARAAEIDRARRRQGGAAGQEGRRRRGRGERQARRAVARLGRRGPGVDRRRRRSRGRPGRRTADAPTNVASDSGLLTSTATHAGRRSRARPTTRLVA